VTFGPYRRIPWVGSTIMVWLVAGTSWRNKTLTGNHLALADHESISYEAHDGKPRYPRIEVSQFA